MANPSSKITGPIYDVYLIGDGMSAARQRWVKVGIAFLNRDQSINVILDALPLNGKLHLKERHPSRSSPGEDEQPSGDHRF